MNARLFTTALAAVLLALAGIVGETTAVLADIPTDLNLELVNDTNGDVNDLRLTLKENGNLSKGKDDNPDKWNVENDGTKLLTLTGARLKPGQSTKIKITSKVQLDPNALLQKWQWTLDGNNVG